LKKKYGFANFAASAGQDTTEYNFPKNFRGYARDKPKRRQPWISQKKYEDITKRLPILCVDIIIRNEVGEFLLVKRKNKPLQGQWWVVGGRVEKNEDLTEAVVRKLWEELHLECVRHNMQLLGYYEAVFHDSPFEHSIHTVSVVFVVHVWSEAVRIELDDQSEDYMWAKELPREFKFGISKSLFSV